MSVDSVRPTVIVTDGNQRAALATVRSLSKTRFRCVVASPIKNSIAGVSRHADREVLLPDALSDPSVFVDLLSALVRSERASLVVPITEPSLLAVLPQRAQFAPAIIPFAGSETFEAISDKRRVIEEARVLGIATPRQTILADATSVADLDPTHISYPVVLKPGRSIGSHAGHREKLGVSYASNPEDLRRRLSQCPASAFPLLLQQRIVGTGIGIFVLRWNGEVRAAFAHRRLWEKPPSGGVSVYCESAPLDPELLSRSCKLLDRFDWEGVAMVEYKQEQETGVHYLMEINGRFWGSLQLAIEAGVDFPRLLAAAALGISNEPVLSFRAGVRSRWWWGQVDHLIARIRRPDLTPFLPPGTPGVAGAVAQLFVAPFRASDREEIFRWADPQPFLYETARWIRGR